MSISEARTRVASAFPWGNSEILHNKTLVTFDPRVLVVTPCNEDGATVSIGNQWHAAIQMAQALLDLDDWEPFTGEVRDIKPNITIDYVLLNRIRKAVKPRWHGVLPHEMCKFVYAFKGRMNRAIIAPVFTRHVS